ncbi:MAG TPA: DUF58 domain-containing protein [Firmicutes bacterium]|nr:DUF58 domain-containing protein [Bacillota bacterium]
MIPKEILKKVRRIEIQTSKLVTEVFSGGYKSIFKGRGMEFSEVRQYLIGDDIRSIDWNVTARMGQPFIKKFEEERELTIVFLLDMSGSTNFGSREKLKSELAAEFLALISFSAIRNNDNIGCLFFTDCVEKYIPPARGKSHTLRIVREALYFKPKGRGTDLYTSLHFINSILKKRAVIFLISDFITKYNHEKVMKLTNKRHDLINVIISDPAEFELKSFGFFRLLDPETGINKIVFSGTKKSKEEFRQKRMMHMEMLKDNFKSIGVDFIELSTETDFIKPVMKFFEKRKRRMH